MEQVTRYDLELYHCNGGEMVESATGGYVESGDFDAMQARAEAAEAKLAELENQEPYGWINPSVDNTISKEYGWAGYITPVFTRPAPAVNVAELQAKALDAAASKAGIYCRAHKTGSAAWHKWKTAVMFLVAEASALRSAGDE